MSRYLATSPDDDEPSEFASNGGYSAFMDWIDSAASKKKHRDVIQLIDQGTCDSPSKAAAQIRGLLKASPPDKDTKEVAETLADLLTDLPDGGYVAIVS